MYCLFNAEGQLLKFGSTGDLSDRIPANFNEFGHNPPMLKPELAVYDCYPTEEFAKLVERHRVWFYETEVGVKPPLNKINPPAVESHVSLYDLLLSVL
ncbi:MAG TPA: hypothetical protein VGN57_08855 [Pirellulaceae bacterium]|nr:hypothetical protein [Pirellulaceae bacterium]